MPGSSASDWDLLVGYRDGLERYSGGPKGLTSKSRVDLAVEVFRVIALSGGSRVLVGGTSLTVLDDALKVMSVQPAPDEEPVRGLLALSQGGFLSYSDDESVRRWKLDLRGQASVDITWPISCLPLCHRPTGKAVICLENGRLCERDPDDGRMVKSWPKSPTLVSAFADSQGHSLVTIDEEGQAQLWDLHSREPLFSFHTPVRLHHGAFQADGSAGVLLSQDGDLLEFKVAAGGSVTPTAALPQPAVDVICCGGEVVALDENGGLWSVKPTPTLIGGAWAGWATSGLALGGGQTLMGTASGELLLYPADSLQRSGDAMDLPAVVRAHQDAVLALFEVSGRVVSVSADGQICSSPLAEFGDSEPREIASFAGDSVVGCHLESSGERLWLALEEGKIVWLDPRDGSNQGETQLPDHRIEEIRPGARPGEILILTDRGSLKCLKVPPAQGEQR
jgi:hypothetical protein